MNLKVENISPAGMMACKIASYKMQAVDQFKDPQMKEAVKAFSLMLREVSGSNELQPNLFPIRFSHRPHCSLSPSWRPTD